MSAVGRLPVPPARYEQQLWVPSAPELYSRAEVRRQTGSYQSAIPARIADWQPRLDSELSADVEDATRALIEFDLHTAQSLGSNQLAISPMAAILLRTESTSSSRIEQLTVTAIQLALAEVGAGESPNSRTVLGNVHAMEAAVALADEISLAPILTMHHELLRHQAGMETHAGRLRDELVWIGRGSAGPRTASYVAPQSALVPAALDDLLHFANRVDLPVLVQIAVAHAQFETIHPFVDGNGRTGRALAQAQLRRAGITSHTTVPVSAGLLTDTGSYFEALAAFREGDAEPIVRVISQAARFAAASGRTLVAALRAQLDGIALQLSGVRRDAAARRLVPLLIAQPIVTSRYVQHALHANEMTANRALQLLVERGVLVERSGKKRNRVWYHLGVLEALDDYAEQLHRAAVR